MESCSFGIVEMMIMLSGILYSEGTVMKSTQIGRLLHR